MAVGLPRGSIAGYFLYSGLGSGAARGEGGISARVVEDLYWKREESREISEPRSAGECAERMGVLGASLIDLPRSITSFHSFGRFCAGGSSVRWSANP